MSDFHWLKGRLRNVLTDDQDAQAEKIEAPPQIVILGPISINISISPEDAARVARRMRKAEKKARKASQLKIGGAKG